MLRATCWTLLVSIALAIGAGPARAENAVGLSLDGQTWTSELQRPLFDPAMRWVPGDTETRSFWVRNQGPTAASTQIAVRTTDADGLLVQDDIAIDARVRGGAWTSLSDPAGSQTLTDGGLAKGNRVRVDLRVAFLPESTNRSELKELPLRFVVRLTQSGVGPGDGDDDGSGLLPDTGSVVEPWLLYLAAALLGGGFLILIVRRRKEESDA